MVKEGYKEVIVGAIPAEWDFKPLKEVCKFKNGKSTDYYSNLEDGEFHIYGSNGPIGSLNDYNFEKGYIVGRVGAVGEIHYIDKPVWVSDNAIQVSIKKKKKVDSDYLFYWLKRRNLGQFSTKSAQPLLNQSTIKTIPIPFPPLPEQKKIASILSSVDKSIEKTDEVIEETKELKKGLMQELLTKGIGHDEFKEVRIGPKTINIPNMWEVTSFEDVSDVNQGLQIAISKRSKNPGPEKLKYITVQHLNNPNDIRYKYYIEKPRDSVICEKEDVLMTRTGNTGEVITNERGVFHNNFFKIDFDREILDKNYLFYYLNSKFIQHVIKIFAGTTTIPDLNHGDFYSIPILIPTKDEQKKIASILSSVDAKIEKEEEYKAKLERLKKGLMQKLLTGEIRVNTDMEV